MLDVVANMYFLFCKSMSGSDCFWKQLKACVKFSNYTWSDNKRNSSGHVCSLKLQSVDKVFNVKLLKCVACDSRLSLKQLIWCHLTCLALLNLYDKWEICKGDACIYFSMMSSLVMVIERTSTLMMIMRLIKYGYRVHVIDEIKVN